MKPGFEWNPEKAQRNLQKHKVSFEEASSVFDDPMFITLLDNKHDDEERYVTIGISNKTRLLLVAHTERDNRIRIISARKATKHEEKFYKEAG